MEYNGGAILAMKGKNCVAIASDKRFGAEGLTISGDFPKVFPMTDYIYLGLVGLTTDVQTLYADTTRITLPFLLITLISS